MWCPQGFLLPPPVSVSPPHALRDGSAIASSQGFMSAGLAPPPGVSASLLAPGPYSDPDHRRKTTRDATAALKTWLGEHRRNPYPSKGEKVLLAILTRMSLTQVSTWFANARRRLKKDHRATWRHSQDQDQDHNMDPGLNPDQHREETDRTERETATAAAAAAAHPPSSAAAAMLAFSDVDLDFTESGDVRPRGPGPASTEAPPPYCPFSSQSARETEPRSQGPGPAPKPKLWSLAEMATSYDQCCASY